MNKITFQEHIKQKKVTSQLFSDIKIGQAFFATWGMLDGFFIHTTGRYLLYFGTACNVTTPPVVVATLGFKTIFENYVPVDADIHITYTKM